MRFEKEMIPLINDFIISKLGFEQIKNEFNSGYGIADIIGIKKKPDPSFYSFNSVYEAGVISKIHKRKWISLSEIKQFSIYSEKYLKYNLLNKFVENGFLDRNKNYYKRLKNIPKTYNPIIAIEAKLSNWKMAFSQALRYKKYADYSYIAILEKVTNKIDIELFKENNIGILSVKNSQIKVFLKANKNSEKDIFYSLFAASSLT